MCCAGDRALNNRRVALVRCRLQAPNRRRCAHQIAGVMRARAKLVPQPRRPLYDARHYYPPRTYVGDSAALRAAERKAVEARDAWVRGLGDAWKQPSGQMQQPPDNSNPDGDEDDDGEPLSPRDQYIQNLQGAYRTPVGNPYASGAIDLYTASHVGAQDRVSRRVTRLRPSSRGPSGQGQRSAVSGQAFWPS
jgi:hypothetical protein